MKQTKIVIASALLVACTFLNVNTAQAAGNNSHISGKACLARLNNGSGAPQTKCTESNDNRDEAKQPITVVHHHHFYVAYRFRPHFHSRFHHHYQPHFDFHRIAFHSHFTPGHNFGRSNGGRSSHGGHIAHSRHR